MTKHLTKGAAALVCALCAVWAVAGAQANEPAAKQPAKPKPPLKLTGHGGPVKALALSADGKLLLSGSFDYSMMAWDTSKPTPSEAGRFDDVEGAINAVAFAAGGAVLAGDDGKVRLIPAAALKPNGARSQPIVLEGHTHKINALDVAPGGAAIASASWDRTARIWTPGADGTWAHRHTLEGHGGPVSAAVFSADGKSIFTASSDGRLRRFSAATGALERAVLNHGWGLNVLTRIAGTNLIAFGATDGAVGLVDAATGEQVKTLAKHGKPVLALAHRAGRLATAGGDGLVRVWNTKTWALIEEYRNPFGPIWALAFSADAKALYYGGLDDAVHIWQVTPRKPFEPVPSSFPRRFQVTADSDDPVERGRIQFARKCSVCHTLSPDSRNRAGPTLHGVFGRRIATVKDYRYSEPLKHLDIVWTAETISKLFELGPEVFTPGSKMPLQKMRDDRERADLIAFLEQATK
ncbi:MAG: c-type cytochrome [Pseudomonadota bacterium]